MSGKKNTPHVDRARPVIRVPKQTDAERVALTHSTSSAAKASPDWAAATDVQSAVIVWSKSADDLATNALQVGTLKGQLSLAEAKQRVLRRTWQTATTHVVSTVNMFAAGSVDTIKGFSLDVIGHTTAGAQLAPEQLQVALGKVPGSALASWKRGAAKHGFVVQHATDPGNPATVSASVPSTKAKYQLDGQPSGSTVYFRVAAIDPTMASGQSPWCVWVAGTVR
jgi:hypothetical protein